MLTDLHRAVGSGRALCPSCAADCGLIVSLPTDAETITHDDVIVYLGRVPGRWACTECDWVADGVLENLEMCTNNNQGHRLHGATFIPMEEL